MFYFDEQNLLDCRLPIRETIMDYSRIWPRDGTIDWTTCPPQMYQYDSCHTLWTPHENALGLSGMHSPEAGWFADQLAPQFATSVQDHWQNDAHLSRAPSLHQTSLPNPMMQTPHPPAFNHAPLRAEAVSFRADETRHPYDIQESYIGQKPISRSLDRRMGASGPLPRPSTAARSRHTPYPLSAGRGAMFASSHLCQWSDGVGPCGAEVAGTKGAIGQHLQTVHAVRFKADKMPQVCHWQGCGRSMRRESIPRHVLTVHMKDKVHCPNCRSQFARPDSLQRHQRVRLAMGVCKVGKRTSSP